MHETSFSGRIREISNALVARTVVRRLIDQKVVVLREMSVSWSSGLDPRQWAAAPQEYPVLDPLVPVR